MAITTHLPLTGYDIGHQGKKMVKIYGVFRFLIYFNCSSFWLVISSFVLLHFIQLLFWGFRRFSGNNDVI